MLHAEKLSVATHYFNNMAIAIARLSKSPYMSICCNHFWIQVLWWEAGAQLTCSINLELPNDAIAVGTNGILKLPAPFRCPTKLETRSFSKCAPPLPNNLNPVHSLAKWGGSSLPRKLADSLISRCHFAQELGLRTGWDWFMVLLAQSSDLVSNYMWCA